MLLVTIVTTKPEPDNFNFLILILCLATGGALAAVLATIRKHERRL